MLFLGKSSHLKLSRTGNFLKISWKHPVIDSFFVRLPLREKCPNMELFLVRIFLYLDWIRIFTPLISVFSPNTLKYGPEITPYLGTFHTVIRQSRHSEAYPEHCQTSKMERFAKTVNGFYPLFRCLTGSWIWLWRSLSFISNILTSHHGKKAVLVN